MRQAFDGSHRRRIHLFRHAEAAYLDGDNIQVPNTLTVPLTLHGRKQAIAMGEFLANVAFDKAICSGLPRTLETARSILRSRPVEIETITAFEEIRSQSDCPTDHFYNLSGDYNKNERWENFQSRVLSALGQVLTDPTWTNLALVAHGGVNRVILGDIFCARLNVDNTIEQNSCCLNVIDFEADKDRTSQIQAFVRTLNYTIYDPCKEKVVRGL